MRIRPNLPPHVQRHRCKTRGVLVPVCMGTCVCKSSTCITWATWNVAKLWRMLAMPSCHAHAFDVQKPQWNHAIPMLKMQGMIRWGENTEERKRWNMNWEVSKHEIKMCSCFGPFLEAGFGHVLAIKNVDHPEETHCCVSMMWSAILAPKVCPKLASKTYLQNHINSNTKYVYLHNVVHHCDINR